MKQSLHPAAIAAVVILFVAAIGTLFVKMGDSGAAKAEVASPYTKVGERPTSPGSGVNSLTGEPLSDSAKAYAASSFEQQNRR